MCLISEGARQAAVHAQRRKQAGCLFDLETGGVTISFQVAVRTLPQSSDGNGLQLLDPAVQSIHACRAAMRRVRVLAERI
jgi:hypothetical protein